MRRFAKITSHSMASPLIIAMFLGFSSLAIASSADWKSCEGNEKTYFSCSLAGGERITLCGLYENGKISERKFIYRSNEGIAVAGAVSSSGGIFKYNKYARYKTEYLRVGIELDLQSYEVYRDFDNSISSEISYGLSKIEASGATSELKCEVVLVDELSKFSKGLQCDSQNALGCSP